MLVVTYGCSVAVCALVVPSAAVFGHLLNEDAPLNLMWRGVRCCVTVLTEQLHRAHVWHNRPFVKQ